MAVSAGSPSSPATTARHGRRRCGWSTARSGDSTSVRHDPRGYDIRTELFASLDNVAVGLGPRMPTHSAEPDVPAPAGPVWADFFARFASAYRAEFVAFLAMARGEAPSPCTAADGVAALRIAEAATRSLREHRPVPLADIPGGPAA